MGGYIVVIAIAATVGLIIATATSLRQAEIAHNYVEANQCHLIKSGKIYLCPNGEAVFYGG